MSERAPKSCDLLLTGGSVITVDDERRVIDPGAVAIKGDRIIAVGPHQDLDVYRAKRRVDCRGKAIIPGLVDGHNHVFQTLGRGLGEGMAVYPWLTKYMWPYARAINAREAVIGAMLAGIEAVRAGVTAVLDDHYAPADMDATLQVAEALETVGLRGAVGRGIFGPVTEAVQNYRIPTYLFGRSIEEEIDTTRAAVEATAGRRVRVWPAPDGGFVHHDLIRASILLARELGVGWHTHCSAPKSDPDAYIATYGIRPVEWLHGEGLLGGLVTLAHGVWLSDNEVKAIGESGSGVSHCPASNGYMADGVIRLRDLRQAGGVVALGTDGSAVSHRLDIFEQMKLTVLFQRVTQLEPLASRAEEAFELATREGARYLGLDAGILSPGKLADVVVVDLEQPHLQPHNRTISTLVYAARGSDVTMTIIGGEVVYESGRATKVDEADVLAEARARSAELIDRAGLQDLLRPWILAE